MLRLRGICVAILYTYGTNSKTVIEYEAKKGVLARHDSTYYEYNALNQVTLVDSFSFEETEWKLTEKQLYYYDNNTNLLTKIEYLIKNGADTIMHSKDEFSYDDNGRDTGLRTHGYRLYAVDEGITWDSTYIYLYTYDEMQYKPLYIEYFYYSDHTPEPSALDNVSDNDNTNSIKIEKVMIDGRIYIIRNGVTFDIMGRRVK